MFDLGALFWTEIGPPAKMGFKNFLEVTHMYITQRITCKDRKTLKSKV